MEIFNYSKRDAHGISVFSAHPLYLYRIRNCDPIPHYPILVFETMDRGWNTSTSVDKLITCKSVDRHDRCVSEKSAKFSLISNRLTDNRDKSYSGCLLVDHTKSHLISDNS